MSSDKFVCNICNLDYSTKSQFEEHYWSLIHHKQLENKFGGGMRHICCLCTDSSDNLSSYAKHLISQKHRTALEERNKWKQLQGSQASSSSGRQLPARKPSGFSEQPRPSRFSPMRGQNVFRGTTRWPQRFNPAACRGNGYISGTSVSGRIHQSSTKELNNHHNSSNSHSLYSWRRQWTPRSDFESPRKTAGSRAGTFSSYSSDSRRPHGPPVISRAVERSDSRKSACSSGHSSLANSQDKNHKVQDQSKSSTSRAKVDVPIADIRKEAKKNDAAKQASSSGRPLLEKTSTQDKTPSSQDKAKSSTSKDRDVHRPAVVTRKVNGGDSSKSATCTKLTPEQTLKSRDSAKRTAQQGRDGPSPSATTREVCKGDLNKPTTGKSRSLPETRLTSDRTPKDGDKTKSCTGQNKDGPRQTDPGTKASDQPEKSSNESQVKGLGNSNAVSTSSSGNRLLDEKLSESDTNPKQPTTGGAVAGTLSCSSGPLAASKPMNSSALTKNPPLITYRLLTPCATEVTQGSSLSTVPCSSTVTQPLNCSGPSVTLQRSVVLSGASSKKTCPPEVTRLNLSCGKGAASHPSLNIHPQSPGSNAVSNSPDCLDQDASVTRVQLPPSLQRELTKLLVKSQAPGPRPNLATARSRLHAGEHHQPQVVNSPDRMVQQLLMELLDSPKSRDRQVQQIEELQHLVQASRKGGERARFSTQQEVSLDFLEPLLQSGYLRPLLPGDEGPTGSAQDSGQRTPPATTCEHMMSKDDEHIPDSKEAVRTLLNLPPVNQEHLTKSVSESENAESKPLIAVTDASWRHHSTSRTQKQNEPAVDNRSTSDVPMIRVKVENKEQSIVPTTDIRIKTEPGIAVDDRSHPAEMPCPSVAMIDQQVQPSMLNSDRRNSEGTSATDQTHSEPSSLCVQPPPSGDTFTDGIRAEVKTSPTASADHEMLSPVIPQSKMPIPPVQSAKTPPPLPLQAATTTATAATPTTPSQRRTPSRGKQPQVGLQEVLLELSLQEELLHQKQANLDNRLRATKALIQKKQLQFRKLKEQRNKMSMEVLGIRTRRLQLLTDATLQSMSPSSMLPALNSTLLQADQVSSATLHTGTALAMGTSAGATGASAIANASDAAAASNRGTPTSERTSTSVHNSATITTSTRPSTSTSVSLLGGRPVLPEPHGDCLDSQTRRLCDTVNVEDFEANFYDKVMETKTAKVPKQETPTSDSGSDSDVVMLEPDSSSITEKPDMRDTGTRKSSTRGKRKLQPSSSAITPTAKKAKTTKAPKKKMPISKSKAASKRTSRGKSSTGSKRKLRPSSSTIAVATKKAKTTKEPKKKMPNSKSAAGRKRTPPKAHFKSFKEEAVLTAASSLNSTVETSSPGRSRRADGLIGMKLRPSTLESASYKEFVISSDSDSDESCKPDSSTSCATQSHPSTPTVTRRRRKTRSLMFPNNDGAVLGMSMVNQTLYTVAADGTARVYDTSDRTCKKVLRDHRDEVTSLVMWTDPGMDSYMCTGSLDHTVNVYNIKTLKIERKFICEAKVTCLVVRSPLLYAAMVNGIIHVFDLKEREKVKSFRGKGSCRIQCMVSLTNNKVKLLGIGYEDWTIGIHSAMDGKLLMSLHGHNGSIVCMAIGNHLLYSGSVDKTLMVHNYKNGRHIKTIHGHRHSVTGVEIIHGLLITSCLDGKIRVFSSQDYILIRVVASFPQMIRSMVFHKRYVYMGFTDGTVQAVLLPRLKKLWRDRKNKNFCQWAGCVYQGSYDMLYNHAKAFHPMTDNQCRWDACLQKFTGPDQEKLKDAHIRSHLDKLFQDVNKMVSRKLRELSKLFGGKWLNMRAASKADEKKKCSSVAPSSSSTTTTIKRERSLTL